MNSAKRRELRRELKRERMAEAVFWCVMIPASLAMSIGVLGLIRVFFTY